MIEQALSFTSMESSSCLQLRIKLDSLNSSNSGEPIITALILRFTTICDTVLLVSFSCHASSSENQKMMHFSRLRSGATSIYLINAFFLDFIQILSGTLTAGTYSPPQERQHHDRNSDSNHPDPCNG